MSTGLTTTLLAVSTLAGGWYVAPRGLRAAWNWSLDMNFLMAIAAAGAWIIGEREEAAATLFLFAITDRVPQYDQWVRALSRRQFAMASFGSQSAVS